MPANNPIPFKAIIQLIGINPFVFVPEKILKAIFKDAGRDKGPIPVRGSVNNRPYKQTLVRYSGEWRLYINMAMLKNSPKRIGEKIELSVMFDNESRDVEMPAAFAKALKQNKEAALAFEQQTPSRKKEMLRYLANLKTAASLEKNIAKAIGFLKGKQKFAGREKISPATGKAMPPKGWQAVQQKQGKVKPTPVNESAMLVNDLHALEKEADVMGALASMPVKKINKKE